MTREFRHEREDNSVSADDDSLLFDDAMSHGGFSNDGELDGIKKPLSTMLRNLHLAPRLVTAPFSLTTCDPRPQRCPLCPHNPQMDSVLDSRGVVLFGNGQQIGVDVNRLQCASCNATSPYEGFDDHLVVMERRQNPRDATTTIIMLDEYWLAELMKNVYLSKDSFTDIYARLKTNAALLRPENTSASTVEPSEFIDVSKTKLIQWIWQAMTHLYPVPPDALSCATCGPTPDVVAFDGVVIGLKESLLSTTTRFHSVQRDQRTCQKVSRTHFSS